MTLLRSCLFGAAVVAMIAGASGALAPLLSTALWLPAAIALVCHRSSPMRRAVGRALGVSDGHARAPEGDPRSVRELPLPERRAA